MAEAQICEPESYPVQNLRTLNPTNEDDKHTRPGQHTQGMSIQILTMGQGKLHD